jgi:hypothetical protein
MRLLRICTKTDNKCVSKNKDNFFHFARIKAAKITGKQDIEGDWAIKRPI